VYGNRQEIRLIDLFPDNASRAERSESLGVPERRIQDVEPALVQLEEWGARWGVVLDQAHVRRLRIYFERLLLWNQRAALVSQWAPLEIACKHFADCLPVTRLCHAGDRMIDLGSGAGFPGLVMAILIPQSFVCLVESKRKKVSFLCEVIGAAALHNAQALEERIEKLAGREQHCGRYSVATARALSGTADFLDLARPFLGQKGRAIAMKGPKYDEELAGLDVRRHGFTGPEITRYSLPDGSERAILEFRLLG